MFRSEFEDMIENMENEDGNFQIADGGVKINDNGEITSINILCVVTKSRKYMDNELKERNEVARKYFPKEYSYSEITEYSEVEELEDGDAFFEFKLKLI